MSGRSSRVWSLSLCIPLGTILVLLCATAVVPVARAQQRSHEPACEVELTEIRTSGHDWWTLGFEATGPVGLLRSQLQATAAHVFAQAVPGGVEPSPDHSRSYLQWLSQRPGTDNDAGP